jgi:hypothetical protein
MNYFDKIKSKISINISKLININFSKNYYNDIEYDIDDLEDLIKTERLKGNKKVKLKR